MDFYSNIHLVILLKSLIHCINYNDSLVDPLGLSININIFPAVTDSNVSLQSLYFFTSYSIYSDN